MLIRIVKMSFHPENIGQFLNHFDSVKEKIRQSSGNQFLELYQDQNNKNIFFTYSFWESPEHLEAYRVSDLFQDVWAKTKPLFNDKPEAWSVDKLVSLP
jgi:(4S)-4-hydroxy-5-phosphonooxypentane-2,3-dione isomerase